MSQIEDLLKRCTVKLSIPGQGGWGTGFFVAPGLILTCAHVVKRSPGQVQVWWQNKTLDAVVERSIPALYDLALLRVALVADVNPPCVWLDEEVQSRDPLYLFGYPDEGDRQGEPRTFDCVNPTGSGLILFKGEQVRPGMSGSPLLNQRTGKVCGMVKITRDRTSNLGGGAIPTRVILEQFPELWELQQQAHQQDSRWAQLLLEMTSEPSQIVYGDVAAGDKVDRDKIGTQINFYGSGNSTTDKPSSLADIDFEPYLQTLATTYEKWWTHYTLTDATGKVEQSAPEQPAPEPPPIFDFGLMVQTVEKETPEEKDPAQEKREKTERLPVLEGIRKYADDHVLLVGRPGSGKSTALIRLLLEEATTQTSEVSKTSEVSAVSAPSSRIPVLVELRYWQGSIAQLILNGLKRHDLAVTPDQLETVLKQSLLLCDGLNELPSEEARTQLSAFRRNHPQVPMIFTTRDLGLGGDLGIEKKLEMQPLTEAQMRSFVRVYVPDRAEVMLGQLSDRLREFGQTPLLLWMLCEVFQQVPGRQLPSNLAEVFRAFTRLYADSSVRKHEVALLKGDVRPLSDRRLWKKALMAIAAIMMQGKTLVDFRVAIHRDEAERELSRVFPNEQFPVRDILDDLLKYHLLQNQTTDQIEFRHQLIQEYYAAEYLLRLLPTLTDDQLKQEYLNYLKWTEPVALMLALLNDDAQALRVVKLAMDDVDLPLGARLAGEVRASLQPITIGWIRDRDSPIHLKMNCWVISHSEAAALAFRHMLKDPDKYVRGSSAEGLGKLGSGKLGSEAAIPDLLQALHDPDTYVRARATDALGQVGSETAIPGLLQALQDEDSMIRCKAVEGLEKLGGDVVIPGLLQALQDPDQSIRWEAANSLGRLGNESIIPNLLQVFQDENPSVRWEAVGVLGRLGGETAIPGLLQALQDPDKYVRRRAVDALGQLGSDAVIPDLLQALQDPDWHVHWIAATGLGRLGNDAVIPGLLQALQDPDKSVRWMATMSLGDLGSEAVIPGLLQALQDPDKDVRWMATRSLGDLGSEAVIPGLTQALQDSDNNIRCSAVDGLRNLGSELTIPGLLQALNNPDESVYTRAAGALGHLGSELAIPGLLQALQHEKKLVRCSAAYALGQLGNETVIPDLLQALQDQESNVRWSVRMALGQLGYVAVLPELWQLYLQAPRDKLQEVISAIQNRCKFYNHEIFQAHLTAQKGDRPASQSDKPTNVFNIDTLYAPGAAINLGGTIEGDQTGSQLHPPEA